MKIELYEQFLFFKNCGRKAEAKVAVDAFTSSFNSMEETREWVYAFLATAKHRHKVRHEIYQRLIYPVLLEGYVRGDVQCILWLAETEQNLYAVKSVHASLKDKTGFALCREAYGLAPNAKIGRKLLQKLIRWFDYAQHEWPSGILYGMDGADAHQCQEILEEVEFASKLDLDDEYTAYLADFKSKVLEYLKRREERN